MKYQNISLNQCYKVRTIPELQFIRLYKGAVYTLIFRKCLDVSQILTDLQSDERAIHYLPF